MRQKQKRPYEKMISYAPFWRTLRKKKISQYDLTTRMCIFSSMLHRLRSDAPLSLKSIAMLCDCLEVVPSEIFTFLLDES